MKARKFLRVPVPMAARIQFAEGEEEFRPTSIRDISWGGAFVVHDPLPEVGNRVILEFTLVDENVTLELWATVVRNIPATDKSPEGVGVEFDSIDEDTRMLLQKLVEEEVSSLLKTI